MSSATVNQQNLCRHRSATTAPPARRPALPDGAASSEVRCGSSSATSYRRQQDRRRPVEGIWERFNFRGIPAMLMFKDGPVQMRRTRRVETATGWAQDPVVAGVGEADAHTHLSTCNTPAVAGLPKTPARSARAANTRSASLIPAPARQARADYGRSEVCQKPPQVVGSHQKAAI